MSIIHAVKNSKKSHKCNSNHMIGFAFKRTWTLKSLWENSSSLNQNFAN